MAQNVQTDRWSLSAEPQSQLSSGFPPASSIPGAVSSPQPTSASKMGPGDRGAALEGGRAPEGMGMAGRLLCAYFIHQKPFHQKLPPLVPHRCTYCRAPRASRASRDSFNPCGCCSKGLWVLDSGRSHRLCRFLPWELGLVIHCSSFRLVIGEMEVTARAPENLPSTSYLPLCVFGRLGSSGRASQEGHGLTWPHQPRISGKTPDTPGV